MTRPKVFSTAIQGLLIVKLDVRADNRGWFKENWQRAKMTELGVPDFTPVQNNVSFNTTAGATRGIHAEPWDKFVSVARGRIFGAWVDLRPGPGFGATVTVEMGVKTAVFVPRGVGNAFQTLEDETVYSYLVTEHWSPAAKDSYTFLNLADETVAIDWPIPLADAELSAADRAHPRLAEVRPMAPKPTLVLGANGQVGRALTAALPDATAVRRGTLDLADPAAVAAFDFAPYGVVINAAAYTKVDAAETEAGRREAWATNVSGTAALVTAAREHHFTLVHISSDYVFDGTMAQHDETEPFSPLSAYAQTKAAGDALVATCPAHYILRTSWVIGDGSNFVTTMASLADRGIEPTVVDDQFGRLTFASEIARAIRHLVETRAAYGTYNLSNAGEPMTWADIARAVFAARGREASAVRNVSTAEYGAGKALARRPRHSTFVLDKIRASGFEPREAMAQLGEYLAELP